MAAPLPGQMPAACLAGAAFRSPHSPHLWTLTTVGRPDFLIQYANDGLRRQAMPDGTCHLLITTLAKDEESGRDAPSTRQAFGLKVSGADVTIEERPAGTFEFSGNEALSQPRVSMTAPTKISAGRLGRQAAVRMLGDRSSSRLRISDPYLGAGRSVK